MRLALFLLVFGFAQQAFAQEAPSVSGFRLGMSLAEARAVDPSIQWPTGTERPVFEVYHYRHFLGAERVPLNLVFDNGVLDHIGGGSFVSLPTTEQCDARARAIVNALERIVPMGASEADASPSDLTPIRTEAGSYIRRWGDPARGVGMIATANAPVALEVRGYSAPLREGFECYVLFGMGAASPLPADLPQSSIESWTYAVRPELSRFYPTRAFAVNRPGDVTMICTVAEDGALSCNVAHESAVGWGFGEAGLRASRSMRVNPTNAEGAPTAGATLRITLRFRPSY